MPITKTFNNTSYSIPLEGELNWSTLSNFLVALADNAQTTNKQKIGTRVATASPVTVLATTDCLIVTDLSVAGAVAVNLPAGVTGQMFTIVDGKGDAGTNNITITPASGNINGAATYVIDSNRAGVTLVYNGTEWTVTAEFISSGDIPRNQIASGSANHVVINDGSGDLSSEAALAASRGGLGTSGAAFTGYVQATAGVFSAASIAAGDLPSTIDATKIADGSVTNTEFQYINTLTSNAQTQISDRAVGAASSTDNAVARFDSTTGKVIQNSGVIIDDSNNVTGVNDLTVGGDLTVNGTTTTINTATLDVEDLNITVNKGGNDASSQGAGLTVDRTGTKGSFIYDNAATSKFKAGDLASEVEIATISGAQVITNKDIDGGTASNTSRITVPKATKSTLDGLTRKEGTLVYASDLDKLYADDGATLKEIGSGGSGINYLADYFTADTLGTVGNGNVTDTGNRGTGTFSAWQSTNTTNISLSVSAASPLRSPNCFLFTGSGNAAAGTTFVESPAFQLHVADLGKPVMVSFDLGDVTADGNFDVCMVRYDSSGVYQGKISIAGNASGATPASAKLPLGVTKFNGFFVANSTSTDYYALRYRRLAGTDVPRLDSIKISPDSVVQGAAFTDWQYRTPVIGDFTNNTSLTVDASSTYRYRQVGDSLHVQAWYKFGADGTAASQIALSLATIHGLTLASPLHNIVLEGYKVGTGYVALSGIKSVSGSTIPIFDSNASTLLGTETGTSAGRINEITLDFLIPISGWSSNVTIANRAVESYYYTSEAFNAAGSTTVEGIDGQATTNLGATVAKTLTIPNAQPNDKFFVEMRYENSSIWFDAPQLAPLTLDTGGTGISGVYISSATSTTVVVTFVKYKWAANDDAPVTDWGTNLRWRVRRVSGGASVGYPVSTANIVGRTDGTTVGSGYIGEKLTTGVVTVTAAATWAAAASTSITLTPGVWILSAAVATSGAGGTANSVVAYLGTTQMTSGTTVPATGTTLGEDCFYFPMNDTTDACGSILPIKHVVTSTSTTYYLGVTSAFTTASGFRLFINAIRIA